MDEDLERIESDFNCLQIYQIDPMHRDPESLFEFIDHPSEFLTEIEVESEESDPEEEKVLYVEVKYLQDYKKENALFCRIELLDGQ